MRVVSTTRIVSAYWLLTQRDQICEHVRENDRSKRAGTPVVGADDDAEREYRKRPIRPLIDVIQHANARAQAYSKHCAGGLESFDQVSAQEEFFERAVDD